MACHSQQCGSLNCPEENDETLSEEFQSQLLDRFHNHKASTDCSTPVRRMMEGQPLDQQHYAMHNELPRCPQNLFSRYDQQTPYPSQADTNRAIDPENQRAWQYLSYHSRKSEGSYSNSLPSYLPSTDVHGFPGGSCFIPRGPHSLPSAPSPGLSSLEQPGSLHSFLPPPHMHTHHPMPFHGLSWTNPSCFRQCGPVPFRMNHPNTLSSRAEYLLSDSRGLEHYRHGHAGSPDKSVFPRPRQTSPCNSQLSQEQRKVFVTYEADSEDHLKEIIKFVALLRNNGFDTHIDVFEQQLNSISKIDCMERYLNEVNTGKDYLIIIIISLKYFETVTGSSMSEESDERTSNTVYIHKQLQSEFIQNGCKNFRFIPVLFPGAKKSYVPSWLQNTHVYSWPRDCDDILRRLMRVEKYKPPPIGPLPTIVPVPI
ncbi:uncharacterized protein traf3ip2b isoform X2 [Hoplias malabaricus]|uniref:uncharacterized protein traf3ip2b isoform X2 n=1 Tax=Hoplias malabaricus TaxID=27720 RepID=UPI00346237AD